MTEDRMALLELVEKGAEADPVREMVAFAAERLMELEMEATTGAAKGMRSALRSTQRRPRERGWQGVSDGRSRSRNRGIVELTSGAAALCRKHWHRSGENR